jgi:hypothetical protein
MQGYIVRVARIVLTCKISHLQYYTALKAN